MAARCESAGRPNSKNEDSFLLNDNLTTGQWSATGNKDTMLFDTDREILLGEKGALMVVCDGMGGMNAGEVASNLAVETVRQWFSYEKLTDEVITSPDSIKRHIEQTIIAADASVKREGAANKEHEGMGSTIVLAWIIGKSVYVGWCGDSRAYRFNLADGLKPLSRDHSYVQELVDANKLSEDLAFDHPNSNIITRSLGDPRQIAQPDIEQYSLRENDTILLCSDGLCGVLRNREIEAVMRQHTGSMAALRDALWEAARNAPWHDNCTIELCRISSPVKPDERSQELPDRRHSKKSPDKLSRTLYLIIAALVLALGISILCNVKHIPLSRIPETIIDFFKPSKESIPDLQMIVKNLREISKLDDFKDISLAFTVDTCIVDLGTVDLSKIDLMNHQDSILKLEKRIFGRFDGKINAHAKDSPQDSVIIKEIKNKIEEASHNELRDSLRLKNLWEEIEKLIKVSVPVTNDSDTQNKMDDVKEGVQNQNTLTPAKK
jgi:serine/threonine protein phosphatase PrpC